MRQKVKGKCVPVHVKKTYRRSGVTAPLMRCVKNDTRDIIVAVGHDYHHDDQKSSRKEGITDDLFRQQNVG